MDEDGVDPDNLTVPTKLQLFEFYSNSIVRPTTTIGTKAALLHKLAGLFESSYVDSNAFAKAVFSFHYREPFDQDELNPELLGSFESDEELSVELGRIFSLERDKELLFAASRFLVSTNTGIFLYEIMQSDAFAENIARKIVQVIQECIQQFPLDPRVGYFAGVLMLMFRCQVEETARSLIGSEGLELFIRYFNTFVTAQQAKGKCNLQMSKEEDSVIFTPAAILTEDGSEAPDEIPKRDKLSITASTAMNMTFVALVGILDPLGGNDPVLAPFLQCGGLEIIHFLLNSQDSKLIRGAVSIIPNYFGHLRFSTMFVGGQNFPLFLEISDVSIVTNHHIQYYVLFEHLLNHETVIEQLALLPESFLQRMIEIMYATYRLTDEAGKKVILTSFNRIVPYQTFTELCHRSLLLCELMKDWWKLIDSLDQRFRVFHTEDPTAPSPNPMTEIFKSKGPSFLFDHFPRNLPSEGAQMDPFHISISLIETMIDFICEWIVASVIQNITKSGTQGAITPKYKRTNMEFDHLCNVIANRPYGGFAPEEFSLIGNEQSIQLIFKTIDAVRRDPEHASTSALEIIPLCLTLLWMLASFPSTYGLVLHCPLFHYVSNARQGYSRLLSFTRNPQFNPPADHMQIDLILPTITNVNNVPNISNGIHAADGVQHQEQQQQTNHAPAIPAIPAHSAGPTPATGTVNNQDSNHSAVISSTTIEERHMHSDTPMNAILSQIRYYNHQRRHNGIILSALFVIESFLTTSGGGSNAEPVVNALRSHHGLRDLVELLKQGNKGNASNHNPHTDSNLLRAKVSDILLKLCRIDDHITQLLSKMLGNQFSNLLREPAIPGKENVTKIFKESVLKLGTYVTKVSLEGLLTDENKLPEVERLSIVDSTSIQYNQSDLLELIYNHLSSAGLSKAAQALAEESNLDPSKIKGLNQPKSLGTSSAHTTHPTMAQPLIATPSSSVRKMKRLANSVNVDSPAGLNSTPLRHDRNTISATTKPTVSHEAISLDSIVRQYLHEQHKHCRHPMQTLPDISLHQSHHCPMPLPLQVNPNGISSFNLARRVLSRQIDPHHSISMNFRTPWRKWQYSRIVPVETPDIDISISSLACIDNQSMLVATEEGWIFKHNLMTMEHTDDWEIGQGKITMKYCPANQMLLTRDHSTTSQLRHINKMDAATPIPVLSGNWNKQGTELICTVDGPAQARSSNSHGFELTLWDVPTNTAVRSFSYPKSMFVTLFTPVSDPLFSPDGALISSGGLLWDKRMENPIHQFESFSSHHQIRTAFVPNNLELITNTEIWDLRSFRLIKTIPSLSGTKLLFNSSGDVMFAGGDQKLHIFDVTSYDFIATQSLRGNVLEMSITPDDRHLVVLDRPEVSFPAEPAWSCFELGATAVASKSTVTEDSEESVLGMHFGGLSGSEDEDDDTTDSDIDLDESESSDGSMYTSEEDEEDEEVDFDDGYDGEAYGHDTGGLLLNRGDWNRHLMQALMTYGRRNTRNHGDDDGGDDDILRDNDEDDNPIIYIDTHDEIPPENIEDDTPVVVLDEQALANTLRNIHQQSNPSSGTNHHVAHRSIPHPSNDRSTTPTTTPQVEELPPEEEAEQDRQPPLSSAQRRRIRRAADVLSQIFDMNPPSGRNSEENDDDLPLQSPAKRKRR